MHMKNATKSLLTSIILFSTYFLFEQPETIWLFDSLSPHLSENMQVLKQNPEMKHRIYRYFYKDKLMVKGHYHAGKKHGEWTRFHDNGSVHIEAIYASGKPHQTWKYFYPNGNEIATISFVSGVGNGL